MQQQVAFDDDVCDVLVDQNAELDLYSAHSLKQQFTCRHATLLQQGSGVDPVDLAGKLSVPPLEIFNEN
jgi:hypothetical protein